MLAYELLSASKPFLGEEDNYVTVAMHHLHTPPPNILERVPDIPGALGDMVQRMLAKDPGVRPTADAVATELALLLAGERTVVVSETPFATSSPNKSRTPESTTPTLRLS